MTANTPSSTVAPFAPRSSRRFWLLQAAAGLAALAGCGGGGGEDTPSPAATGTANAREFRGTVTEVQGPDAFSVEGIRVDASGSGVPPTLAVGSEVAVSGVMTNGVIQATRIQSRGIEANDDSRRPNRVEGRVTSFDGLGSFTVNGIPVDASGAQRIRGTVAVGAFVDVRGIVVNGILVANRVRVEDRGGSNDDDRRRDDDRSDDSPDDNGVIDEIKGRITAYTSSANFSIGSTRVNASSVANLPAGLGIGVIVEMDGRFVNGIFVASTLKIDD